MSKGILGKKVGMTQIFTENGELIPVTVIEATPNTVLQVKSVETDGYEATQVGFDTLREVLTNKPAKGHVDVTGTSKGKGFQGPIKRHGQSRGPMAHGSRYHRRPGSMGPVAANKVPKGKKLAGRMGNKRVTVQNLVIAQVLPEKNVILVKGNVPGAKKSLIVVKSAIKAK